MTTYLLPISHPRTVPHPKPLKQIVSNPRILARVTQELHTLDPINPEHRSAAGMAARLPYLDLCVKETLRLYPAISFTTRRAARETALGGYFMPHNAVAAVSITNLHRDPSIWGADAAEFRPERWEDGLENRLPKAAFLPFGMGPRVCLGMRLSLIETRAVVAILLKRLEWAPPAPPKKSRRRRAVATLRRLVGRSSRDRMEEAVERLRITYPGTAAFPDGVKLRAKGRRQQG